MIDLSLLGVCERNDDPVVLCGLLIFEELTKFSGIIQKVFKVDFDSFFGIEARNRNIDRGRDV